jgi:hypothetical protein
LWLVQRLDFPKRPCFPPELDYAFKIDMSGNNSRLL